MFKQLLQSAMSLIAALIDYLVGLYANFTTSNNSVKAPSVPSDEPHKCRYRLDNDSSDTVTLPDGRKLGYAQYGSLTGRPIFFLHGLPGSRLEAALWHDMCLEIDARVIATDRPGIGWSSPHPDRTILDHQKDLEHLANHLGLDEYSVLGMSGGGPYALACAASMPCEKLKAVSIVCGLGPPDIGMIGARLWNWIGLTLAYVYFPNCVKLWMQREPEGRLDLTDEQRLELVLKRESKNEASANKDLEFTKDEDFQRLVLRGARESFAQGFDGFLQDGKLVCMDFGFRVEDIRHDLPVQLWYGKQDVHVPPNHGVQIAVRLGGRASLRMEDETHLSLEMKWQKEIWETLIKSM